MHSTWEELKMLKSFQRNWGIAFLKESIEISNSIVEEYNFDWSFDKALRC